MIKEYIKNVTGYYGGTCILNEKYSNIILTDIVLVEFKRLYINIILQFHEEGIIDLDEIGILGYDYIKSNINSDDIGIIIKLNSLFSKLPTHVVMKVTTYFYHFLNDYYNKYCEDIIYIDTDSIYMKNIMDIDFLDRLKLPYKIINVNQFFIFNKKRYLSEIDLKIKKKGFPTKSMSLHSSTLIKKFEAVERDMLVGIRNKKLEIIGI